MTMKVAKFGGTSLASAEQIQKICGIITSDPQRRLVVVSAPGKRDTADIKVTDLLIETARARLTNQDGQMEMKRVIERYSTIVRDLDLPDEALEPIVADLGERLAMTTDDKERYMDTIKAGGEDNSARLVAEAGGAGHSRTDAVRRTLRGGTRGMWRSSTPAAGSLGRRDA